jgi:zinc finger protein 830
MSDARALLKAKRAEARISHPYATYTAAGQLRCTVCGTPAKHWEGHLGSKAHRTAVLRVKEEAERRRIAEEAEARRREAEERADEDEGGAERLGDKRRASGDSDASDDDASARAKRQRTAAPPEAGDGGGFPGDFFSDPTRAPPARDEDEDAEMADTEPAPPTALDAEWAAFQASVLAPSAAASDDAQREAFARATVFAEPELAAPSSFPLLASAQAEQEREQEMTDAQKAQAERRRREQEDRELIMDRLVEEERVQEEADERVSALKSRLERAKRERAARKAAGAKS